MSISRAVLLVGELQAIRPEWEDLSNLNGIGELKEYGKGSREDFFKDLDSGEYDDVFAVYQSNESTSATGPFNEDLINRLPSSVKYICHKGAGYDNIDVAACTKKGESPASPIVVKTKALLGIQVSHTPQAVDGATADIAVFLMLGALRLANIPLTILREGRWGKDPAPLGRDPYGKTLGILGMGSIGRNFAAKARAFGIKIQYHNRTQLPLELEEGAEYVDFETLLSTSDVFSLNLNSTKATEHIIGKDELALMKRGVVIINTARGKLIDEAALVDALNDGERIWSAGLDVFESEPAVHPGLVNNPRVFLLPHIGTLTSETRRSMELSTLENLKSAFSKGQLLTRVKEQDSLN